MKRRLFFSSCLILTAVLFGGIAFAAPKTISSADVLAQYPGSVSGDYVIYRDYTWKDPTWIGFLRYDDSTWGALCVTPSTGSNVSVLFRSEIVDGKFVLTGQNIISKITQDDVAAVNYLMRLLPDFYAWRHDLPSSGTISPSAVAQGSMAQSRSTLLPAPVFSARNLSSFGGDVSLVWLPEIPVFNLAGMNSSGGNPLLALARIGRIKTGGENDFFLFSPLPEGKGDAGSELAAKPAAMPKSVDGVKLKLDDQWKVVADNTFFMGNNAVLIVDTIDLASVGITSAALPISLVRLFSLSSSSTWAIPEELSVTGTSKKFRIANLFHDTDTGVRNRDIKTCIPSADGKKCTIISLSVHEGFWRAHRAYFDSLF